MSAPNARTVIAAPGLTSELFIVGDGHQSLRLRGTDDVAAIALSRLKAAAGGGRFIVIDTEGCDGDGTVWGLEQPGSRAGLFALSPDGLLTSLFPGHPWDEDECTPLYVLTTPADATGSGGDTARLPQDGPAASERGIGAERTRDGSERKVHQTEGE